MSIKEAWLQAQGPEVLRAGAEFFQRYIKIMQLPEDQAVQALAYTCTQFHNMAVQSKRDGNISRVATFQEIRDSMMRMPAVRALLNDALFEQELRHVPNPKPLCMDRIVALTLHAGVDDPGTIGNNTEKELELKKYRIRDMEEELKPPSLVYTFCEAAGATADLAFLCAMRQLVLTSTPHGNGTPVLVLPGLGAHDLTTELLRRFLNDKGHVGLPWNGRINTGPSARILKHLPRRLDEVVQQQGRKVVLVGHSLGGVYARELARQFPEKISQVITLGSPFGAGLHPAASVPLVRKAFAFVNGHDSPFLTSEAFARQALTPPPVPTTAIYTQFDGVVNWKTAINPKGKRVENVEVWGSHCGLVVNYLAWTVIADRLGLHLEGGDKNWKPFEQLKYMPLLSFPTPQAHVGQEPVIERGKKLAPIKIFA